MFVRETSERNITTNMNYLLLLLLSGYCLAQVDFECPDEFEGYYPHDTSCDRYWECKEGRASLETCGNGLAFDDLDPTYTTKYKGNSVLGSLSCNYNLFFKIHLLYVVVVS